MPPDSQLERPIPLGIFAESGESIGGIDDSTLESFAEQAPEPERAQLAAKSDNSAHFGVIGEIDAKDLAQTGWAVMFAPGVEREMREALRPLLDHRKAQVGDERLFRVFEGPTAYRPGDTAARWLARQDVRQDIVDPNLGIPYYLLIVGQPDEIPFDFQYAMDIYWAVGRLWFPSADDFRMYAASVIQYETMPRVPTSRQLAIFAPENDGDQATRLFRSQVANSLAGSTLSRPAIGQSQKFAIQPFTGKTATKDALNQILSGAIPNGTSAVVFSGSHGAVFRLDDPQQIENQGAIVCQDWEGPGHSIHRDHRYAASDLSKNAKVHGLVHVLFACYGAGCPQFDTFNRKANTPKPIAPKPFLSRLPQALLSHSDGGALAVLGHVDRAWSYSFQTTASKPQIQAFRDVIGRVLQGERLGQATDQFNIRWAVLSTELAEAMDRLAGIELSDMQKQNLAKAWIARDDARNYIIFGDPAVQLRVAEMPQLEPVGAL